MMPRIIKVVVELAHPQTTLTDSCRTHGVQDVA